jgi:hypothetical protein
MEKSKVFTEIVKVSGKTIEEVSLMVDTKRQELGGLVSEEGALAIIANQFDIKLDAPNNNEEEIEISEADDNNSNDDVEEMTLDDLGKKFIKSPKVGEDVEFVLKKIQKNRDVDATDKDGKKFKVNLTSVDYKIDYISTDGEAFSPKSWEVVGKINGICKKLKKIDGVKLKVAHIKDGMKNKEGDNYEVKVEIDGEWKQLDRKTQNWV